MRVLYIYTNKIIFYYYSSFFGFITPSLDNSSLNPILSLRDGFLSVLSITTNFRLNTPQINILTKTDLLSDKDLEIIKKWSDDIEEIYQAIQFEQASVYREISESISKLIHEFGNILPLLPTSHDNFFGLEDIYTNIQLQFSAGEDLLKD